MGMQIGGKRRILVRPERGWFKGKVREGWREGGRGVFVFSDIGFHPSLFPFSGERASKNECAY